MPIISERSSDGLLTLPADPFLAELSGAATSRTPTIGRLGGLAHLDLAAGADNLLGGCIGAVAGDRLLVLREDSCHGFYDCAAAAFVADYARVIGLDVMEMEVAAPDSGVGLPIPVIEAMLDVDHALFFARIGDQLRFDVMPGNCSKTISYAFDATCLGSRFGTTPYGVMSELKTLVDKRVAASDEITITCPLGTELTGKPLGMEPDNAEGEVHVRRFPLTVFKPVPAAGFSGRVALSRWLVGSGSRYYEPYAARLEGTAFALLEAGRIVDYEGPKALVDRVRDHHNRVGEMFGIDPSTVHSWHAGIHPQTFYPLPAMHNLARWSALAFGSPRYLHFHVCGDQPPGEISWTVIDPTVLLDGEPAWDQGRLALAETSEAKAILERFPEATSLFNDPTMDIGI
ncbi:MAG: hypothetical protein ACRBM6_24230 [Geminicoccales bacterium]